MARAMPREANWASLLAWTLFSLALVATTARVVFPVVPPIATPRIISPALSMNSRLLASFRAPATILPVAGSRTSPRALTATRAETRTPHRRFNGKVIEPLGVLLLVAVRGSDQPVDQARANGQCQRAKQLIRDGVLYAAPQRIGQVVLDVGGDLDRKSTRLNS